MSGTSVSTDMKILSTLLSLMFILHGQTEGDNVECHASHSVREMDTIALLSFRD